MPLFFGPWTGAMHHAMPAPFNLDTFGKLVSSVRPTSFQGVPSIALQIANTDLMKYYDFSSAEVINCGGASMKPETVAKLRSRAPIGNFLPNVEAVLKVSGTSEDASEGGPGELWIRGPNPFPELEGQKWYNTGDVCTIDKNGTVSVVGRTKELIKYKDFQVSPVELESHLNSHPYVIEAGVGAVWDESQVTELPTAYVVLNDDIKRSFATRALKEIQEQMDHLLSGYKKLRGGIWAVTTLPKNAKGKILRPQLRDHFTGACSLNNEASKSKL
ncbi:acetyl-CoA synthetase-like protein [Setomelanomma holmii]|uniref:Acetyl-CoA synthetase-like protein n=1 Tax=Setomelanomma holmii TaxID=210430 RepID=A0A9P4H1C9_9PLEO|nr:acetyl-CoA synthetase-like protein [Setomelanomma holmii]